MVNAEWAIGSLLELIDVLRASSMSEELNVHNRVLSFVILRPFNTGLSFLKQKAYMGSYFSKSFLQELNKEKYASTESVILAFISLRVKKFLVLLFTSL